MATKKTPAKKTAAKTAAKTPAVPVTRRFTNRAPVTAATVLERANQLKSKAQATPASTPVEMPSLICTEIRYVFNNGTVLHADGRRAEILFKFIQECEQLATVGGLATYNGEGLRLYTQAKWNEFQDRDLLN